MARHAKFQSKTIYIYTSIFPRIKGSLFWAGVFFRVKPQKSGTDHKVDSGAGAERIDELISDLSDLFLDLNGWKKFWF